MNELCKRRNTCRLCNKTNLKLAFNLEPTPPANAFVDKQKISINQDCYPLDIFFCEDCNHVQLLDVVDSNLLFEDYVYVSGTSPIFVKHFEEYANFLINNYLQNKKSLVIDIGSNDGTLLHFFKENGNKILGIDPAKEISSKANSDGIETLNGFFTFELSKSIRKKYGCAEIITANNVFAHVNDMKDLINGIKNLLSPNTQYRSLLIFHGVGVGKTCSGISIAENFKDVYAEKENRIMTDYLIKDKIKSKLGLAKGGVAGMLGG